MRVIRTLEPYSDEDGNEIVYSGKPISQNVRIRISGKNNRLVIAKKAKIVSLAVEFAGSDGKVVVRPTTQPRTGLRLILRVGHRSRIRIGENVGTTARAFISAVEGASVTIGDDCMIATAVEIRTDDAHAIYDVRTGKRTNKTRSIEIADHVWIAKNATIMGGVTIGQGSVIGFRSIVTHRVPNNVIAVGAPAKVVRKHIVWERPSLRGREPGRSFLEPEERTEQFWQLTREEEPATAPRPAGSRSGAAKRRLVRWVPRRLRPPLRRFAAKARQLRGTSSGL